jgi:hypothetical protein
MWLWRWLSACGLVPNAIHMYLGDCPPRRLTFWHWQSQVALSLDTHSGIGNPRLHVLLVHLLQANCGVSSEVTWNFA